MISTTSASTLDRPRFPDADTLNRVVKLAVDSGDVATIEAGYELLRTYRLGLRVGPEIGQSAAHQAALLTIVNIARRAFLGGISITGNLDVPLVLPLPGSRTLQEAVHALGAKSVPDFDEPIPTLLIGSPRASHVYHPITLFVCFSDWRGGVVPGDESKLPPTTDAVAPAAILAGALAVSEVFQHLRGNPMAGRRRLGLSLWSPEYLDWETAPCGPMHLLLPSHLWLIGLGHLGQAYLWVLGLLPYQAPRDVRLVLQDFDHLAESNDSTSLLTNSKIVGQLKTRAMAAWAERRGFTTRLVERPFPGGIQILDDEPRVALGGVDNFLARAAYQDAGFDWIVEAGLGSGPVEYLALRVHTFPATKTARERWGDVNGQDRATPHAAAYRHLAAQGMDECGLVRLASRTIGVPFVGTVAATLVIAEVLRFLNGGKNVEVLDMTLRDPLSRSIVVSQSSPKGFNPGFTR